MKYLRIVVLLVMILVIGTCDSNESLHPRTSNPERIACIDIVEIEQKPVLSSAPTEMESIINSTSVGNTFPDNISQTTGELKETNIKKLISFPSNENESSFKLREGFANIDLDMKTNIYVGRSYTATIIVSLSNRSLGDEYKDVISIIEELEVGESDFVKVELVSEDLIITRISDSDQLKVDFDTSTMYIVFNYRSELEGVARVYVKVWKNQKEHTIKTKIINVQAAQQTFMEKVAEFLTSWQGVLTSLASIIAVVGSILIKVRSIKKHAITDKNNNGKDDHIEELEEQFEELKELIEGKGDKADEEAD